MPLPPQLQLLLTQLQQPLCYPLLLRYLSPLIAIDTTVDSGGGHQQHRPSVNGVWTQSLLGLWQAAGMVG